jgi:phosphoenolpyruvate---glycerone phosphotransferase subunit DhaK
VKKILNQRETIISDMLNGFIKAERDHIAVSKEHDRVLYRKEKQEGKVGIVLGGGSGHEPLFFGLLGKNLADAVAVGNVFAAPTPQTVLTAIHEANQGSGVICLFGNYAGDVLNYDLAKEMADSDGIAVVNVAISDDIASAPKEYGADRRGIAGDLFVIKEVAAAAAKGYSLERCQRIAEECNQRTYSIGVGIKPGTNPLNGKPSFTLNADEIEFGLGIHGEPGIEKMPIFSAEELVKRMYSLFDEEITVYSEKEVIVCVNGLGSTTLMELYIITNEFIDLLEDNEFLVLDTVVGNFCTTQEMAGFSLTVQILTEEIKELYQMEAMSPHYFHKESY